MTIPAMQKEQIDEMLQDPSVADFERKVLSDYQVTDAEYEETKAAFQQCMADRGWTATFSEAYDANIQISGTPGGPHATAGPSSTDIQSADFGNCLQQSGLNDIQIIYLGMKYNPQGMTTIEQVRACFKENGISDGDGLSDDQLNRIITRHDPMYEPSSAQAALCLLDPSGEAGVSLDQAEQTWDVTKPEPT